MPAVETKIINKLGLHARASAKLTRLASSFDCEVQLGRDGRKVNAKSIMGVMMLAAACGTTVEVETEGRDAEKALEAIIELIQDRFGEEE